MAFSYQQFRNFVEQSELMAVVSSEKKRDILERYKGFDGEQLEEAVKIIEKHESRWKDVKIGNDKKLGEAKNKLNQALQLARGRTIEDIQVKESKSRESEADVLSSLEDKLDNLPN